MIPYKLDQKDLDKELAPEFKSIEVYCVKSEQTDPPLTPRKFRVSEGKVVKRDPKKVTGITIHQTGVEFGVADYQIIAAGGNRKVALALRSLNVACHAMAFREGFIAWPNELDWYVYHGNKFNSHELGLEIDGNYAGVAGGKTWNGKKATKLSEATIDAARAAIKLLFVKGRQAGMPIKYIHAHRQSSSRRRSDPGEEIWRNVVLDYGVKVLGLKTEPQKKFGHGRPIPVDWDPNGLGGY